jgi:D-alanyl-D-alanine carboxypeptidase
LSPDNRLTVHFLVGLLRYAYNDESMRQVLIDEALATPGHPIRHGSLLGRMTASEYRDRIFVKTGTLTTIGLSSLAGYAQTTDGRWLVFAIINEDSPVAESRMFQDRFCRELVK